MIENLRYSGYHPDYVRGFEKSKKYIINCKPTKAEIIEELEYYHIKFKSENTCHIFIAGAIDGLQYFVNLLQLQEAVAV